jgi:N-acetylglucosaminyl-diphospho-decaprenol L-rhamnosyltransferase
LQLSFNDPGRLDGAGDNYLAVGVPWRGGHGHDVSTIYKMADGEVFFACAAAALYRTEVFKAAGGFGEDYFCYVEDVDLEFRLRLFGGRVCRYWTLWCAMSAVPAQVPSDLNSLFIMALAT